MCWANQFAFEKIPASSSVDCIIYSLPRKLMLQNWKMYSKMCRAFSILLWHKTTSNHISWQGLSSLWLWWDQRGQNTSLCVKEKCRNQMCNAVETQTIFKCSSDFSEIWAYNKFWSFQRWIEKEVLDLCTLCSAKLLLQERAPIEEKLTLPAIDAAIRKFTDQTSGPVSLPDIFPLTPFRTDFGVTIQEQSLRQTIHKVFEVLLKSMQNLGLLKWSGSSTLIQYLKALKMLQTWSHLQFQIQFSPIQSIQFPERQLFLLMMAFIMLTQSHSEISIHLSVVEL